MSLSLELDEYRDVALELKLPYGPHNNLWVADYILWRSQGVRSVNTYSRYLPRRAQKNGPLKDS